MKKIVSVLVVAMGLVLAGNTVKAQAMKIGYCSLQELIPSMPEYKKADSAMTDFQSALQQEYDELRKEFNEQDSLLSSRDSLKYTKAQLELKKKNLGDLYAKLQGWPQQAQQMSQQKQQELLAPITAKATDAIKAVARENGYTYVLAKEQLLVSPPAEDILPLVKKRLGIK